MVKFSEKWYDDCGIRVYANLERSVVILVPILSFTLYTSYISIHTYINSSMTVLKAIKKSRGPFLFIT